MVGRPDYNFGLHSTLYKHDTLHAFVMKFYANVFIVQIAFIY